VGIGHKTTAADRLVVAVKDNPNDLASSRSRTINHSLSLLYVSLGLSAFFYPSPSIGGGSVAEWLACWIQAQKGLGSNRSRDVVG